MTLGIVENALTANSNKTGTVTTSDDGTAGDTIRAPAARKLTGKIPVSDQDVDPAAVKCVITGTQTMTVYKPLKLITTEAAQLSVALAKGDKPKYNTQYDNGKKKVDTVLLRPTQLTRDSVDLAVKSGFYTQVQIGGQ